MTKKYGQNEIANRHNLESTNSSSNKSEKFSQLRDSGKFSQLRDEDFIIDDTQTKRRRTLAVIVGFIISLTLMVWPIIFPILAKKINRFVALPIVIGSIFFYIWWIVGNNRKRYTLNWENYLIIPVLGTIASINIFKIIPARLSPELFSIDSLIIYVIYLVVKAIHLNTMARVDDFFSKKSCIYFTTRVLEAHTYKNNNSQSYYITVVNSNVQKQTFDLIDYMNDCKSFYNKITPGSSVIALKTKQCLINNDEPFIKGFEIIDKFVGNTDAEVLQDIESKNIENDQKIDDDDVFKLLCIFIIIGIKGLVLFANKWLPTNPTYIEDFHEWNYAYIITAITIATIWTIKSISESKKNKNSKLTLLKKYYFPMDLAFKCALVLAIGEFIISIISCFV